MAKTRDTSKRILKTRDKIKDACKEMICEMEPDKINVSEITRRAGIYRKTFYLHFTSIEALFEDLLLDTLAKYMTYMEDLSSPPSFSELNGAFFRFCSELEPWEEKLICNPGYASFSNRLFATSYKRNIEDNNVFQGYPEDTQYLIAHFLISNSLEFSRNWVSQGKEMSLKNLTDTAYRLLSRGIFSFAEEIGVSQACIK